MESDPETSNIMMQLIVLVLLTLINAFFAGAEMAVVSVNKNKIRNLSKNGNKNAQLIEKLFEDSTKFLSTIQVAITFAGFFSSASAATGISQVFGKWLSDRGIMYGASISFVVVTIILSYFTLVFGELVPKRVALQKAESFSLLAVKPIYFFSKLLSPFIRLLSVSTNLVLKLFGMKTENLDEAVSEEEIKAMLDSGHFNKNEKDMINSVFSFNDMIAREVMIPRIDVYMINIEEPMDTYIDDMLESRHSRIPIYKGDKDNIIGVLQIRDFIIEAKKKSFEEIEIQKIMQKPYFVPETKSTDALFKDLQKINQHMALLIDEYGSFSGIVTVEDLVEEIVGDINDEYDEVEPEFVQLGDSSYAIDGSMSVDDLNETLGLDLKPDNYDTVSGFLIEHLGFIPSKEDRPVVEINHLKFTVMEVKYKRIEKVRLDIFKNDEILEEEIED